MNLILETSQDIRKKLETTNIHKQKMPYIQGGWVK
jgi:hypothetical protein